MAFLLEPLDFGLNQFHPFVGLLICLLASLHFTTAAYDLIPHLLLHICQALGMRPVC